MNRKELMDEYDKTVKELHILQFTNNPEMTISTYCTIEKALKERVEKIREQLLRD